MMQTDLSKNCPHSTRLFDMALGPLRWNLLQMGFEWGIFDILKKSKSATEVADLLDFKVDKTSMLLDALTSLDFLEKSTNSYKINPNLAPMLLSDSPTSMRQMLLHLNKVRYATVDTVKDILMTGESNHISANFSKPEFWDKAVNNLRSFHSSLSNEVSMEILQKLPQWKNVKSMLDIGAGSEYLAKALIESKNDLHITIFDLEPCAARIKHNINSEESKRINIIAGDYNLDSIGQGYDVIWASMSLYFSKDLHSLLKQIRLALNKSGKFISLHEGLYEEGTKPEKHVVGRFIPTLNGSNLSFKKGFIRECLHDVGFTNIKSNTLITPYGYMEVDIASVN